MVRSRGGTRWYIRPRQSGPECLPPSAGNYAGTGTYRLPSSIGNEFANGSAVISALRERRYNCFCAVYMVTTPFVIFCAFAFEKPLLSIKCNIVSPLGNFSIDAPR